MIINNNLPSQRVQYLFVFLNIIISAKASILFELRVFSILLFFVSMWFFYKYENKFGRFKIIISYYFIWGFLIPLKQNITIFDEEQFVTFTGLMILVLNSYFSIRLVDDFISKYVKIVYYLAFLSIPLFLIQITIPNILFEFNGFFKFFGFGRQEYTNSILFTHYLNHSNRNCGFSWEPGAYSVFLNIAIFFNIIRTNKIYAKTNIILITALLTTFSTTGYIGFILILALKYVKNNYFSIMSIIKLSFLLVFIYFVTSLSFVGEKTIATFTNDTQFTNFEKLYLYSEAGNRVSFERFASFLIYFKDFTGDPIFGRGINKKLKYYDKNENIALANGVGSHLVSVGSIGFLLLLILMFLSIRKYFNSKYFSIAFLFIILSLTFSEPLLYTPLIFSISFLIFKYY